MTDKELRKLKRNDILQLLLAQANEAGKLQEQVTESQAHVRELEGRLDRLKAGLDAKDAQIDRVKRKLDLRDERIREMRSLMEGFRKNRRIELEDAGDIAEAAHELNRIFETAQHTAEQYESEGISTDN